MMKNFENYPKRAYCKDIGCPVQQRIEEMENNHSAIALVKVECKTNCRKTAWAFHDWLQERGYVIVRPKGVR